MILEKLKQAERLTETNLSDEQRKTGNYQKGLFRIEGLVIAIENPRDSIRSGYDKEGNKWENKMPETYGYIKDTIGVDGDEVDIFVGRSIDKILDVFVIDQINPENGAFDEHKVMFGFKNEAAAKKAYLDSYSKDWKGFQDITKLSLSQFKDWVANSQKTRYPASREVMNTNNYVNLTPSRRIAKIELTGEVILGETLNSLREQAGDPNSFDELIVEIASPGGSVAEGLEIMIWLDLLSQAGKQIITVVTANAYSIASLIMLSANVRLISSHAEVMVHNPMIPELKYANANELEEHLIELRNLETIMYQLYEVFTGLSTEQIKALMDEETYLKPEEAVQFGFADKVIDIQPKSYEMTTNNKKEVNMSKTINMLNRVLAKVNGKEFVNQLYYSTEGGQIEIFQQDPASPMKGDKTNLENGVVTLLDGSTVTVENFIITEIVKGATPPATEPAVEPVVEPTVEPTVEPVVEPVVEPAIEQVITEPAPAVAPVVEPVKPTEAVVEPVKPVDSNAGPAPANPDEDKIAKLEARLDEMESKLEAKFQVQHEAKVKEIEAKYEAKFKEVVAIQDLAATALESIAENTSSSFKPVARARGEAPKGGKSIFQEMQARVQAAKA